MVDTRQTRRRLLQTAGVAIGSSVVVGTASADHEETWTFHADLSGEGHGIETPASGRATFEIPPDDHRIHYTIDAEWLCYGTQAHIHLGEEGEDGPVVAWLYPEEGQEPETIEGRFDGTLAEGSLTADDLVGPLEGADLGEIVSALIDGGAYVNVHTEDHPGGEIRGQIRPDDETAELIEAARDESGEAEAEEGEEGDDEEEGDDSEGQDEDTGTGDEQEDADDEGEDGSDDEGGSDDGEEDGDGEEDEPDDGGDEEDDDGDDDEEEDVAVSDALAVVDRQTDVGHDTDQEYILFENTSSQEIDLSGYIVTDRPGEGTAITATFPDGFTLGPSEQVRVTSGDGEPTDGEIFMGSGRAVWREGGDVVVVEDPDGNVVFEHEYGDQTSSIRGIFGSIRALFA